MTLSQVADQWLAAREARKAAETAETEAAEVLKTYFRRTGKTTLKGKVVYSKTSYRALDAKRVRELLGDRAGDAEVTRVRETLTPNV